MSGGIGVTMYRVAYATGSRADYGIVRNYLKMLENDTEIELTVLVTGSHLEIKFGRSVSIIEEDGFEIGYRLPLNIENSNNANILHSMSIALDGFGSYFENNRYDMLIILGDRYEMMAVATAAAMQKIPILHLHGGEITYGNYDEFIRHSITKMSQYHFTSTEIYRNRVIQLGESPDRVFYMGALGAENCKDIDVSKVADEVNQLSVEKYWVVAFHPETLTNVDLTELVREIISAIDEMINKYKIAFIGTNADTNSDIIQKTWKRYANIHENAYYFENLNTDSFLWLVKKSIALVGNSSSGIIEAPSLGVYTINIGDRQKGRVHGNSVIDVQCSKDAILKAMAKVIEEVQAQNKFDNPYYFENAASRYYEKTKEILKSPYLLKTFYDL